MPMKDQATACYGKVREIGKEVWMLMLIGVFEMVTETIKQKKKGGAKILL